MGTPGLEGKFDDGKGLQNLLQVPSVMEMYGRIGGVEFYESTIGVLKGLIRIANTKGLTPIVEEHSKRLAIAQSLLEKELQRVSIPTTALDAEPRMEHRDGKSYIVFGDGPGNGGYSIELTEGENIVHW